MTREQFNRKHHKALKLWMSAPNGSVQEPKYRAELDKIEARFTPILKITDSFNEKEINND
jgi:hypothetical protein